jgi:O-antigen/teichoic acid export membrane protein
VLLVFYSELIVTTLFTSTYLPAVPIFNVYAFFLLRRCFNMDVLLRTTGRTGFMLWGTIGALVTNVLLILLLSRTLGMIGPAIAFIAAEVGLELYYVQRARQALKLSVADLADWSSIFRITISCALGLPILIGLGRLPVLPLIGMAVAALLYLSFVLWLANYLGVKDVGRVIGVVVSRFRGLLSR